MLVRFCLGLLVCLLAWLGGRDVPLREGGAAQGGGGKLQLEATLAMSDGLEGEAPGKACLLLKVSANAALPDGEVSKTPLNIALVLDRSDSMKGAKLKNAQSAARFVVDALAPEDRIALVVYDNRVQLVSPSVQVGGKRHRKSLKAKVDGIYCEGATNLSGGMLEGFNQVDSLYRRDYVNRVLLLSDGLANKGITDPFSLKDTARQMNRLRGITLSTFGLGADFDEDLMEGLADFGGGNYYFVERESSLPETLLLELERLQAVSAQDALLTVVFPSELMRLGGGFAYDYIEAGADTLLVPLNDFFAGESKTAMLCFDMEKPLPEGVGVECSLKYQVARDGSERTERERVNLSFGKAETEGVGRSLLLFSANERMRKAINETGKGNFEEARELASGNDELLHGRVADAAADSLLQQLYEYNREYLIHIDGYREYSKHQRKMLQKDFKNRSYKLRKGQAR